MSKIYGFFHVGNNHNNPQHSIKVVSEILSAFKASEIMDATTEIYSYVVGQEIQEITQLLKDYNIKIVGKSSDCKLFEFPTIDFLIQKCKMKENCKIWYSHTKGAFNVGRHHQRKGLIEANILGWKNCVNLLDNFDICGARYFTKPYKHFAGNYWWANSNYIKKLPPPSRKNRFDAERWVCKGTNKIGKIERPVTPEDKENPWIYM